ncbi:MAG: hypothetical protein ACKOSS_05035 [Planctomycetia bacterium]
MRPVGGLPVVPAGGLSMLARLLLLAGVLVALSTGFVDSPAARAG